MVLDLDPAYGPKPKKIVQRTSSEDNRSEITQHTWLSLLTLLQPRDYIVTVDYASIWRKHLSWSKKDGKELRAIMTARFGTNMIFMSMLLGAEINVFFNSSRVTTKMRVDMEEMNFTSHFFCGIFVFISVICTLFTLLTTFTAWSMVSSLSDTNTHCMLRSSIGQYVCFLPSRLIVAALYSFLTWMVSFVFILMPHYWSVLFVLAIVGFFFHVTTVYSAFGRLIMHSGGMASTPIFDSSFEEELLPRGLHTTLLFKALDEIRRGRSVTRQYKNPSPPIGRVDPITPSDLERDTMVHFFDSEKSPLTSEERRSIYSNNKSDSEQSIGSLAENLSKEALERWASPSGSASSFDSQESFNHRTSLTPVPVTNTSHFQRKPPKIPRHGMTRGTQQGNEHGSISKLRPRLLNAGSHRAKSIRRMAAAIGDDDDADKNVSELGNPGEPYFSGNVNVAVQSAHIYPNTLDSNGESETQQLIPSNGSLKPQKYSDNGTFFSQAIPARKGADTSEVINIASRCLSSSHSVDNTASKTDALHGLL